LPKIIVIVIIIIIMIVNVGGTQNEQIMSDIDVIFFHAKEG